MAKLTIPTLLVFTAGLLPAVADAQIQVPQTVAFSARLLDNDVPFEGTQTVILRLFDADTGGNEVWNETHGAATFTGGLVYLDMGSQTALTGVFFGADRYLEIDVGGQTMSPRLAVQSVPYAMRAGVANDAENLGGNPPSDYVYTAGAGLDLNNNAFSVTADSLTHNHNVAVSEVSQTGNLAGGGTCNLFSSGTCPAGSVAVSGGCTRVGGALGLWQTVDSFRSGNGWICTFCNNNAGALSVEVFAYCLTVSDTTLP